MPRQNKIILRNGTTTPNANDFDIGEPAWDKTAGKLYVKNGAGSMVDIGTGGASFTGGTLTSNLTVASGTTTLAPLTFQSGTNLTTETAGCWEFDGALFYSTPASRGISPSMLTYRLDGDLAGANVNTEQSIFGVGVTLQSNTVYSFRLGLRFTKSSGTTSHSFNILFGGTAAINNGLALINSESVGSTATNTGGTGDTFHVMSALGTARIIEGSLSLASMTVWASVEGTVSIGEGGTFIPQYKLTSVAPGGAYSTMAGSFMEIWPIGAAGSNISVGPWA